MKEQIKIFLILSSLGIFLVALVLTACKIPGGGELDENTVEKCSDLFFNYEISRYPTGGEIVAVDILGENISVGLVTDPWNLNFGTIPSNGSYAKRSIVLSNSGELATRINFRVFGDIFPLISFSKDNFVINTGEQVNIDIYFFSNNTEAGNYSGEIQIISRRPKFKAMRV